MNDWIVNQMECPFLPVVDGPLRAAGMKKFGKARGVDFYRGALECAQSLWMQGLPAQALLQLNRAFSADLNGSEAVLDEWELPYRAMRWIMAECPRDQFIGNPRRHFQHLATRMVEPRRELRSSRAWACWLHAVEIFPNFPGDEKQLVEEGIAEPDKDRILEGLRKYGHAEEDNLWLDSLTRPFPGERKESHCK
ncbi:MAG: hypothetical protein P1U86_20550 [Verrucomicrobiales bacterium]|nr:hypothetical protein [Verrucomicrobiales bacterium]